MGIIQKLIYDAGAVQTNLDAAGIWGYISRRGIGDTIEEFNDEILSAEVDPAEPNGMRMLGMLAARAGLVTDELTSQPYYAFGADSFSVEGEHQFGRGAFEYASECSARGDFGYLAFSNSQKCTASGRFSDYYFSNASGFKVDGEFAKRHGFVGAKGGRISGTFGGDDSWPVFTGEQTVLFSERIGRFLPGEGSIVIYREGSLANREMPKEMTVLGIGYIGDDGRITPIEASSVPTGMNATEPDFPGMVVHILRKYDKNIPQRLGEAAGII